MSEEAVIIEGKIHVLTIIGPELLHTDTHASIK